MALRHNKNVHTTLQREKLITMSNTGKIVTGAALLIFGSVWALEITNVINISFKGWWTIFIIIPCLISVLSSKHKAMPLVGLGTGVLLLLSTRGIIDWNDFWKYIICMTAIIWGIMLLFYRKSLPGSSSPDKKTFKEVKEINQDGRIIRQINTSFGKQLYDFSGQRFEGATVETSFGFVGLDLRNADILDGAIIDIKCSFGGMEIRVDKNIIVKHAIETSFAGLEYNDLPHPAENAKTVYIKGECAFGGIEIK